MAAMHIVVITPRTRSLGDKGADMLDSRETARCAGTDSRRHAVKERSRSGHEMDTGEHKAA